MADANARLVTEAALDAHLTAAGLDDASTRLDVVGYDSGWRNLTQYLAAGWTGTIRGRRLGQFVTYQFRNLTRSESGGGTTVGNIPGFLPGPDDITNVQYIGGGAPPEFFRIAFTTVGVSTVPTVGLSLEGDFTITTTRGAPTNPPGIPA